MDSEPYGRVRTCIATHLSQLSTIITSCRHYIPPLSAQLALTVGNRKDLERILGPHFRPLATKFDDQFYGNYLSRIKQLLALGNQLTPVPVLHNKVILCLQRHNATPVNSVVILALFHNFCLLQEYVLDLKNLTETVLYEALDKYPSQSEVELRSMMREVSPILVRVPRP